MSPGPDRPDETAGPRRSERPRDAATLVIVDHVDDEPRFLMGKRRPGQVFLPSKVVFPGGRVDDADRDVPSADDLAQSEIDKLLAEMKGHPSVARARAMALAAVRETFEETGLIVGRRTGQGAADERIAEGWQDFFARGFTPLLGGLCLFARAITPPGRPRRYDTRFFCVDAGLVAEETGLLDDELSELNWYSISEAKELDLPPITRVVIEDLTDRLAAAPLGPISAPIPFYHQRHGNFRRDLLGGPGTDAD